MKKEVTLSSGETLVVSPIPFDKLSTFLDLIAAAVKGFEDPASLPKLLKENWEVIRQIFAVSLQNGESDVEKISGFDDPLLLFEAIFEVNGGKNLMRRLNSLLAGAAQTGQGLIENTQVRKMPPLPKKD